MTNQAPERKGNVKAKYMQTVETITSSPNSTNAMLAAVPIRIQRSRQHKQVSPNGLPIVYVGRPSRFGNSAKIGEWCAVLGRKCENINDVIESYRKHLQMSKARQRLAVHYLQGKNLSCWCKLGEPCHADVLLEFVKDKPYPYPHGHGS